MGLTQASVYLARFAGDKVSEENEIPVSAILLPDFSGMTEQDSLNAPAIRLSETDIDLSARLAKKNKASHDIVITNVGKAPLQISKLRVTIHKKNTGKKKHHLRILMITNDPAQPKVEINVKR